MRRTVLLLATIALAILLASGVAQAIINGELDRGPKAHPYVGAYVAKFEGELLPVCSGTLISPKVFLTAGHCMEIEIEKDRPAYVSFDPTYKPGASQLIMGTPYLHPKYCIANPEDKVDCAPQVPTEAYIARERRYDVGVVVLEEPVRMDTYGALPEAGLVDTLKEGQRLTTVGYGATRYEIDGEPPPRPQLIYPDDRYRATVRLLNTKDPAVGEMLVKTTGVSLIKGKGESPCYGDSGGPLFVGDQQTIVGVSSLLTASVCRGPVHYQRMDLPGVLSWVRSFP
jgi:secreted trypsin-like serine protease